MLVDNSLLMLEGKLKFIASLEIKVQKAQKQETAKKLRNKGGCHTSLQSITMTKLGHTCGT